MMSLSTVRRAPRAAPAGDNRSLRSKLRLYVAAGAPNSERAQTNLGALRKAGLLAAYEVEVVDVLADPKRALADGVRMTPTLLEVTPECVKRIAGPLGEPLRVLSALGLTGRLK